MKLFQNAIGPREFITLMALLMSIVAISIDAMVPALAQIGHDLGATNPNQPQFIILFIFVGMTVGQLISGPMSDAYGRKNVLFATVSLYFVGSLICLFSHSMEIILLGRFIQGLGVSGPYVCSVSIVRDKFHGRQMARIMSLVTMIFIMVPAVAPSLGQGILALGTWRTIFAMYIVYALIILVWAGMRMEETLPANHRIPFRTKNILHGLRKVFHTRTTLCYTACMGLIFGGLMAYLGSCQQIFQGQFNVGNMFALYFGGLALMFGASSIVNARLVEKRGMRPLCRTSLLANIAASAVFLGLHFVTTPTLPMFLLYIAIMFFNFGMMYGNLNALAMEPMGNIAGLASAIIGALSSLISLTTGTLIGQLYNGTLLPLAAGFLILGTLAYLVFQQADKPSKIA